MCSRRAPGRAVSWLACLVSVSCLASHVAAFSFPNEPDTCAQMIPTPPAEPQTARSPFKISVDKTSYTLKDSVVMVRIVSTTSQLFRGFMIKAVRIDGALSDEERALPVGYFDLEAGTQSICGGSLGNALTHSDGSPGSGQPKSQQELRWTAIRLYGHVEFRATIAVDDKTYWVSEKSDIVVDQSKPIDFTTTPVPPPLFTLDLSGCGDTKGCYRYPPACDPASCEMVLTWTPAEDDIFFEMGGNSDGWIAAGFSEDKKMGNDDVIECSWNNEKRAVDVMMSKNKEGTKMNELVNQVGLVKNGGYLSNGRIYCRFRYQKEVNGRSRFNLQAVEYHILMARGALDENGNKKIHEMEPGKYPYVSPQKVSLVDIGDYTETARYPLVKAHACLMIIAWMMCATTAILMAKYYKPMWPNDRLCRERVWFAVHRGCQITNLVCTVIAFILIFVHVRGYSWMPELPAKAHPPLGIVTTLLCVLNPLIALCRCDPKAPKRPIFNWIHWFVGTAALILATPTIMIGLNLPKAHVPWWATWVMVSFMLFHLVIELILEIHGCMNGKKQKVRNEEFQMKKQNDSRGDYYGLEPEPVGTRFKKTILSIYLFVVIVLGLVMIITIALG